MSRYRQTFNEALQQVEKWSKDVEVKSTGEHAGKTIDQLKKEVDALRGKPNNEKEMGGLLFAIRAKQGWKKGEGSTGVEEATQIKHEKGEVKVDKAERGERKAGESDDDYEDRESGGKRGLRPNPFEKKKKQNDLDRDDEAQATRSKVRPTAEGNLPPHLSKFLDKKGNPNPEAAKRMAAGQKKRAVATKVKDVTPKGYGPNEEVEVKEFIATYQAAKRQQELKKKQAAAGKVKNVAPKGSGPSEEVKIDELSTDLLGRYKTKAAAQSSAAAKAGDHKKSHKRYKGVNTATTLQFRNDAKKEALDTWHPDPAKDRKSTSMKHTAKSVAHQAAQKKKPMASTDTRQMAVKIQDILRKQRERKAGTKKEDMSKYYSDIKLGLEKPKIWNVKTKKFEETEIAEDLEFKVTIKGIPPFYVPAKTAAAVKQSLRKQLKHPDDIQSIIRVTKAAQKIDYRKRAQGKSDEDNNKK